jgi:serine O-acetyltransferase
VSTIFWTDARELAAAARREAERRDALHMMTTDAYWLLALFRLRQAARRLRIPLANRILRLVQMMFGGVELGNEVRLGPGVYFIHSLGTVVGGNATVGARVRFMGNNTVGTASDNGYPVIEDDVEIGAGARVLGPVRIGAGAVIGANAVVLSDIPAGAVAVGAPARIVRIRGAQL